MREPTERCIGLANEYAAVRLTLDESGKGPRIRITSNRDSREAFLDPVALDLICHADASVFALLADAARDSKALADFAEMRRGRPTLD